MGNEDINLVCVFSLMCPNSICSSLNHANMLQVYQIQQPNHYKNNKKKYKMLTKSREPSSDSNNFRLKFQNRSWMNIQNIWSAITNFCHRFVIFRNHCSSSKGLWHMKKKSQSHNAELFSNFSIMYFVAWIFLAFNHLSTAQYKTLICVFPSFEVVEV